MASKPSVRVVDERNSIIYNELIHVKQALDELKERLGSVVSELSTLKFSEITELKGDMKVLKDRASRHGAIAGLIGGALVSGIVSVIVGLLLRK